MPPGIGYDKQDGLAALDAALGDMGALGDEIGADVGQQPLGEPLPVPPGATGTVIGPNGEPVTGELVEAFTPPQAAPDVAGPPVDMAGALGGAGGGLPI